MTRFAELSECEFSTILEEKDAENIKKATKVTLVFRGYLQEKGLSEASQINYLPLPSASANNWSARH